MRGVDAWAAAVALGISPALFVASVVVEPVAQRVPLGFDEPVASGACAGARIVLPPSCAWTAGAACGGCTPAVCEPASAADEDWVVRFAFVGVPPEEACALRVEARDVFGRSSRWQSAPQVPGLVCEREAGRIACELPLAPWRPYGVALVAGDGAVTTPVVPVVVTAFRAAGLDARASATWRALGLLALGVLVGGGLWWWAVDGPRVPRGWLARPRARGAVTLAVGGGVAAALAILRPPDYGGYDVWSAEHWRMVPLTVVVGGLVGAVVWEVRAALMARPLGVRLVWVAGVLGGVWVLAALMALATSDAVSMNAWQLSSLKGRYHAGFFVAFVAPCVLVSVGGGQRRVVGVLVALMVAATVLMGWVGIAVAEAIADPLGVPGQVGFYKPLSAWGLVGLSVPAMVAFAVAATVRGRAPEGVAALSRALARALEASSPLERGRLARAYLDALVAAADEVCAAGPWARPLAHLTGFVPGAAEHLAEHPALAAALAAQARGSRGPRLTWSLPDGAEARATRVPGPLLPPDTLPVHLVAGGRLIASGETVARALPTYPTLAPDEHLLVETTPEAALALLAAPPQPLPLAAASPPPPRA